MNHANSGLAHGTYGSAQLTIVNGDAERKATANEVKLAERVALIEELERNGVKFSKDKIVFITRDKTDQIVWLETGSSSAGLKHILNRHADQFEKAYGIQHSEIPEFLHKVISEGTIISNQVKTVGNRKGFERIYSYNGKKYLLTGVGTNGFVVSAYPISD